MVEMKNLFSVDIIFLTNKGRLKNIHVFFTNMLFQMNGGFFLIFLVPQDTFDRKS